MLSGADLKNETAIAKALDITPQALSNFKSKGELPADRIVQFAMKFNLSVDWLLTGKGKMTRSDEPMFSLNGASLVKEDPENYCFVPQVRGEISAGGGLLPDDTVDMKVAFRREWIARRGDPTNMSLIRVSGDSMEPTLFSGDLILVDHGRNYIDAHGGIYAISMDHTIMIKRMQMIQTTGKVRIISDNGRYEPIDADPLQVKVNGKVIWFGRELER